MHKDNSNSSFPETINIVCRVPTKELKPHPNNPFNVRDDSAMAELTESIKKHGILVPIAVRKVEDGYEIISGHRRQHAAKLLGMEAIPVIVVDANADDAIIQLVDSNIQREGVLPSERAWAYRLRMEAIKRKAGRPSKELLENSPTNSRSDDNLGGLAGVSGDTIRNYIALTNLIPEIMNMVDEKQISLSPAYLIASLSKKEQELLLDAMEQEQSTPSVSQAKRLKQKSQAKEFTATSVLEIMREQKKTANSDITLTSEKLKKYFPKSYSPLQMEAVIFRLLDAWQRKREHNQSR